MNVRGTYAPTLGSLAALVAAAVAIDWGLRRISLQFGAGPGPLPGLPALEAISAIVVGLAVGAVGAFWFGRIVWNRIVAYRHGGEGNLLLPIRVREVRRPGVLGNRYGYHWDARPVIGKISKFLRSYHYSDVEVLDRRSTLVLGQPGAGKSETMKDLVYQMRPDQDETLVVFDYGGELKHFFEEQFPEYEIDELSLEGSNITWNIFLEVDDEDEFKDVGRSMFPPDQAVGKEFFDKAARQVFVATLKYLYREGRRSGLQPDNRELKDFFQRFSSEEVYELMTEHDDLKGALTAMDPQASKQAVGVWATLQQKMEDMFMEDFAKANGEWCISDHMRNPDGRILILNFPISKADSVQPIYRFLIDWSIRRSLDMPDRETYYLLDEFARLPHLQLIEELVNAGRSREVHAVLGLQSVTQLIDQYGEEKSDSILAGLVQQVLMQSNDSPSVDHIIQQTGRNRQVEGEETDSPQAEYAIDEQKVLQMETGEAVVTKVDGFWSRGKVFMVTDQNVLKWGIDD